MRNLTNDARHRHNHKEGETVARRRDDVPAVGKTTLARALADELQLPLVTKDEIKQCLYDAVGVGDVEGLRRLGGAAYTLIFGFVRELLAAR